ncbi:hypothetical protein KAR02_12350 [Candidatus Bipolaricaulota bacterium]|nr:hypothetical protein [Candidatus Bipolaricaulota bacterium]
MATTNNLQKAFAGESQAKFFEVEVVLRIYGWQTCMLDGIGDRLVTESHHR